MVVSTLRVIRGIDGESRTVDQRFGYNLVDELNTRRVILARDDDDEGG